MKQILSILTDIIDFIVKIYPLIDEYIYTAVGTFVGGWILWKLTVGKRKTGKSTDNEKQNLEITHTVRCRPWSGCHFICFNLKLINRGRNVLYGNLKIISENNTVVPSNFSTVEDGRLRYSMNINGKPDFNTVTHGTTCIPIDEEDRFSETANPHGINLKPGIPLQGYALFFSKKNLSETNIIKKGYIVFTNSITSEETKEEYIIE